MRRICLPIFLVFGISALNAQKTYNKPVAAYTNAHAGMVTKAGNFIGCTFDNTFTTEVFMLNEKFKMIRSQKLVLSYYGYYPLSVVELSPNAFLLNTKGAIYLLDSTLNVKKTLEIPLWYSNVARSVVCTPTSGHAFIAASLNDTLLVMKVDKDLKVLAKTKFVAPVDYYTWELMLASSPQGGLSLAAMLRNGTQDKTTIALFQMDTALNLQKNNNYTCATNTGNYPNLGSFDGRNLVLTFGASKNAYANYVVTGDLKIITAGYSHYVAKPFISMVASGEKVFILHKETGNTTVMLQTDTLGSFLDQQHIKKFRWNGVFGLLHYSKRLLLSGALSGAMFFEDWGTDSFRHECAEEGNFSIDTAPSMSSMTFVETSNGLAVSTNQSLKFSTTPPGVTSKSPGSMVINAVGCATDNLKFSTTNTYNKLINGIPELFSCPAKPQEFGVPIKIDYSCQEHISSLHFRLDTNGVFCKNVDLNVSLMPWEKQVNYQFIIPIPVTRTTKVSLSLLYFDDFAVPQNKPDTIVYYVTPGVLPKPLNLPPVVFWCLHGPVNQDSLLVEWPENAICHSVKISMFSSIYNIITPVGNSIKFKMSTFNGNTARLEFVNYYCPSYFQDVKIIAPSTVSRMPPLVYYRDTLYTYLIPKKDLSSAQYLYFRNDSLVNANKDAKWKPQESGTYVIRLIDSTGCYSGKSLPLVVGNTNSAIGFLMPNGSLYLDQWRTLHFRMADAKPIELSTYEGKRIAFGDAVHEKIKEVSTGTYIITFTNSNGKVYHEKIFVP
jgi:hypothetical protein